MVCTQTACCYTFIFTFIKQAEVPLSPYFLNEIVSQDLKTNIQPVKTHSL